MKKIRCGRERSREALGYVNGKASLSTEGPGMVAVGIEKRGRMRKTPYR